MSLNSFGLGFIFGARDDASPVMRRVNKNFTQLDRAVSRTAQRMQAAQGAITLGLAGMAAGAGAVALSLSTALSAGEFEQQAVKVGQIASATTEQLEQLRSKALDTGLATQFSPTEAIQGLGELTVRGLTATEAMGALDGALDLAAGGMISIQDASSTTVAAMKVFGLGADEASFAADRLLKISNVTSLKAMDLELALGTVARGAIAAGQGLNEMLPAMGLVKGTGVEASVAARSVSRALISMAQNAEKFGKLGVKITEPTGEFRDFLDIIQETDIALGGITDSAKRTAAATDLFGAFGLAAFTGITKQLQDGIKTPTGEILKGAAAIDFLRKSMVEAGGTAERFRKALLDTLPGQLVLLKGTAQTLAVVLGGPLAEALKPLVTIVKKVVFGLITFFQELPKILQKSLVIGFLVGGMLLFLGGASLVLVGTFVVMLPILKAAVLAFVALLPAIALAGAAAILFIGTLFTLKRAFDLNIGGFGDTVRRVVGQVKLFFEGLFQLIDKGFISGDTAKKLRQPENVPILRLLGTIVRVGFRAQKFFDGLMSGFNSALLGSRKNFEALSTAIGKLGAALGLVSETADASLGPSSDFAKAGKFIGNLIGRFFVGFVDLLTFAVTGIAGFVTGFNTAVNLLSPLFQFIGEAMRGTMDAVTDLLATFGLLDSGVDKSVGVFEGLGRVLGFALPLLFKPLLTVFAIFFGVLEFGINLINRFALRIIDRFRNVRDFMMGFIKFVTGDFSGGWTLMKDAAINELKGIRDFFVGMFNDLTRQFSKFVNFAANILDKVPEAIRPQFVDDFITRREIVQLTREGDDEEKLDRTIVARNELSELARTVAFTLPSPTRTRTREGGTATTPGSDISQLTAEVSELVEVLRGATSTRRTPRSDTIKVIIDGVEAQSKAVRRSAALSGGADLFLETD